MINVERSLDEWLPYFSQKPLFKKPTIAFLKRLMREKDINQFVTENEGVTGFAFIDRVFSHFNFTYNVDSAALKHIPSKGRVVVFANQPIGSLDSLALIKLIGEVRQDIKIVTSSKLRDFAALDRFIIPTQNTHPNLDCVQTDDRLHKALEREHAVIVFPASEVSRVSATGVKDSHWRATFFNSAKRANAPLLPVRIHAKNSWLFYGLSFLSKPLSSALLPREMFKHRSHTIHFSIGGTISPARLNAEGIHDRTIVTRLKKHIYKLGTNKRTEFVSEAPIADAEPRDLIEVDLEKALRLGETRDHNVIYLAEYSPNSALIREIGRLRELTFRMVGEGTGKSRDLDLFDEHYKHLILWDTKEQQIAGSYRLGEGKNLIETKGESGFYTRTLYDFNPAFKPYLEQGLELGRSFVNPAYWGRASLDYLWQGLGTYLSQNSNIRYLIGPVSMSAQYPKTLMDEMVYFYTRYYSSSENLVVAHYPYQLSDEKKQAFDIKFGEREKDTAFDFMQKNFIALGHKLPVLYKQYTALFEDDGFQTLVFSIDPDFGDCLDGLCMCDLAKIKEKKRKRYIGS